MARYVKKAMSGELNKIKFHLKNLFATIWLEINAKGTLSDFNTLYLNTFVTS